MTKMAGAGAGSGTGAGSGVGSVNQTVRISGSGSVPNVADPQHCIQQFKTKTWNFFLFSLLRVIIAFLDPDPNPASKHWRKVSRLCQEPPGTTRRWRWVTSPTRTRRSGWATSRETGLNWLSATWTGQMISCDRSSRHSRRWGSSTISACKGRHDSCLPRALF